jgi:hypothetical protein
MQLTAFSSTSLGRLTAKDIRRMQADGLIDEDDNFELIEGRIVPIGPKYHAHERLKSELGMALARLCPPDLIVGFETSLFLGTATIVEPDLCIYPRRLRSEERCAAAMFCWRSKSRVPRSLRIAGRKQGFTLVLTSGNSGLSIQIRARHGCTGARPKASGRTSSKFVRMKSHGSMPYPLLRSDSISSTNPGNYSAASRWA